MHNLPSPVLDEIRREFLADTEEILGTLEELLPVVRDGNGPSARSALDETYRRIHSLKGSAGMFGFPGVSTLCHDFEEFLEELRRGGPPIAARDMGLLGRTIVLLRAVFSGSEIRDSSESVTARDMALLGEDFRARRRKYTDRAPEAVDETMLSDLGLLSAEERGRIRTLEERGHALYRFEISAPAARFAHEQDVFAGQLITPLALIASLPGSPGVEGSISQVFLVGGPGDALEALRAQGGRALVAARSIPLEIALGGGNPNTATGGSASTPSKRAPLPEDATPAPGSVQVPSVRVRLDELELLTEIAGEVHLAAGKTVHRIEGRSQEQIPRAVHRETLDEAQHLARRAGELRRHLLSLRMVPIRPVLTRFFPIVQSLAWESGREIELVVEGEETRVDRSVLEGLGEPLLHLVRNAVDHGLELPEERIAAGKDRRGRLILQARAEGQHVTVEVHDDGRGIDRTSVARKARERGLLSGGIDPHDEDLWRCLFSPGFTTRDRATELSGRGVGLDVVRRAVLALQGLVEVVSTPGSGTRIVLRLPQTLTVTRGLVVRQGGNLFAFPLHSIVGVRTLGESRTQTAGRGLGRGGRDGEAAVPLLDLGRFFGMQPGEMARASRRSVVLAGVAEKRVGIVVEKIVSQEELLVRALGPLIATHPGLSGVAELAGGQLALVVDITAAIAFAAGERNSGAEVAGTMGKETRG